MIELLDRFVQYVSPEKLSQWKSLLPIMRTYEEQLTRFDAMGAMFLAAYTVGGDWADFKSDYHVVYTPLQFPWNDYYFTEGLFGEYDGPRYAVPGIGDNCYLDLVSLIFNLSRQSSPSDEYLFPYDTEANSIHEYEAPSYADGLLAVVRLIASGSSYAYTYVPTEADAVYLDAANTRCDEIRNAKTDLPNEATGTNYYISNNGSDADFL